MKLSDYNYDLPIEVIADRPPEMRGNSRLLVLDKNSGQLQDRLYKELPAILKPGDLLILNNTKVIKARLEAFKAGSGAKREIVVLEKHSFDNEWYRHKVLYRKSLREGDILKIGDAKLEVTRILGGGVAEVISNVNLLDLVNKYGEVPLPPYMHRRADESDEERYQTIWAENIGSVAAPTASLNMTKKILDELKNNGIKIEYITLHVGLGTFLPIREDNLENHKMHQEYFEIPNQVVRAIHKTKQNGGRVISLGTTVARALEFSHEAINGSLVDICGEADIFIYPGYKFKIIDGLLTNYHAPKSTVLMLTAAFAGWDNLLPAYKHAINNKYRFLSYGDSMLIV